MQFTRRNFIQVGAVAAVGLLLAACGQTSGNLAASSVEQQAEAKSAKSKKSKKSSKKKAKEGSKKTGASASGSADKPLGTFEKGFRTDRGFEVDDLLRNTPAGDVHFSLHVPDSYDGSKAYALYVHCPGYEGLWFQGAGANLGEDFPFVGNDYIADMIVVSPQLDDWGSTSAKKTIALTRWMLANYNIDSKRVYLSGYSGGGETISIVLGKAPKLYRRALHMSSQWDGNTSALAKAKIPVRLSIGAEDEYYSSAPARRAYREIRGRYRKAGLSDERIGKLLVLDVKPSSYFDSFQETEYHEHGGGAALFSHDEEIMGWLFR